MSLVDFMSARLNEDEKCAQAAGGEFWWSHNMSDIRARLRGEEVEDRWIIDSNQTLVSYEVTSEEKARYIERYSPLFALEDIAAQRKLVGKLRQFEEAAEDTAIMSMAVDVGYAAMFMAVACLAEVHKDHPDFNQAWLVP